MTIKARRSSNRPVAFFESLEQRTFLSVSIAPDANVSNTADPKHMRLARQMLAQVTPDTNIYSFTTSMKWRGVAGSTVTSNSSVCSSLVAGMLKQAYGITGTQLKNWTTDSAPEAEDLYYAGINNFGFTRVMDISRLQVGDMWISKYLEPDRTTVSATGHCAFVAALPKFVSESNGERTYTMQVIDCTGSPHTNDSRSATADTGIGTGTMRMITDTAGLLIKWSWGVNSTAIHTNANRPALFMKAPNMSGKTNLGRTDTVDEAAMDDEISNLDGREDYSLPGSELDPPVVAPRVTVTATTLTARRGALTAQMASDLTNGTTPAASNGNLIDNLL